jgi:hypothetical protein
MLAWFDTIKALTEKSGEERNAFVRRHASVRSTSAGSARSASSDGGLEEDEADAVPYSANQSLANQPIRQESSRPSPGGRFPSDLNVNRNLQAPLSPSSGSSDVGHDLTTAAGGPAQDIHPMYIDNSTDYQHADPVQPVHQQQQYPAASYVNSYPPTQQQYQAPDSYDNQYAAAPQAYQADPRQYEVQPSYTDPTPIERHESNYGNWMAPAAGGAAGAAGAALAVDAIRRNQMEQQERAQQQELNNKAQLQKQDQHYPVEQPQITGALATAPAVPERDPDHYAPVSFNDVRDSVNQPSAIPVPIVATGHSREPVVSHLDNTNTVGAPSTTNSSFLDDSEVGPAFGASGKTINSGPVPIELVEAAQAQAHPGMHRTNTDISVSDLHVPGEYPKAGAAVASKVPAPVTEESMAQM